MIYKPMTTTSDVITIESAKLLSPVFETVDEARQSLVERYGKREYLIEESHSSRSTFDVIYIKDNKMCRMTYDKKITGYY